MKQIPQLIQLLKEKNHLDKGEGGNRWKIREVGVMERS